MAMPGWKTGDLKLGDFYVRHQMEMTQKSTHTRWIFEPACRLVQKITNFNRNHNHNNFRNTLVFLRGVHSRGMMMECVTNQLNGGGK